MTDSDRDEQLRSMTTAELLALANSQGMNLPDDTTKAKVLAALGVEPAKKK